MSEGAPPAGGRLAGASAARRLDGDQEARMYYVWVTLLLAVLVAGMGAGLAFAGRLDERED